MVLPLITSQTPANIVDGLNQTINAFNNQAAVTVTQGNNGKIAFKSNRFAPIMRDSVRQLMLSPPTVSWGTTNSITGRSWPAANNGAGSSAGITTGNYFTYTRCGSILPLSTAKAAVQGNSINYGSGNGTNFNVMSVSFIYTGSAFSISCQGYAQSVLIKVDDQYVTATPQTFANNATQYYGIVTFASAGRRRIEIIFTSGTHGVFNGIFTAATDTVQPSQIRGPRVIFVGDSYLESPDTTASAASSYPVVFSELMGWDDVWSSGVGSTGFVATSGNRGNYYSRLVTDVLPYTPDAVVFQGSINDNGASVASVIAQATLCFQYIQQNLPNTLIMCTQMIKQGASYCGALSLQQNAAFKVLVQSFGGVYLDTITQPLQSFIAPQTATLYSSATAGATSLSTNTPLLPYTAYALADGTSFICTAVSGGSAPFTATIDNLENNQSVGATVTLVGPSWLNGGGRVGATTGVGNGDVAIANDFHPTQIGAEAIAEALAYSWTSQLYSN